MTIQPSGMSDGADWTHLLPTNYYENLVKGKSGDYIDVYITRKFGKTSQANQCTGFNEPFHVAKGTTETHFERTATDF